MPTCYIKAENSMMINYNFILFDSKIHHDNNNLQNVICLNMADDAFYREKNEKFTVTFVMVL